MTDTGRAYKVLLQTTLRINPNEVFPDVDELFTFLVDQDLINVDIRDTEFDLLDNIAVERVEVLFIRPKSDFDSAVDNERFLQDQQWGGSEYDDQHSPRKWFQFIEHQLYKFGHDAYEMLMKEGYEDDLHLLNPAQIRLVKIGALAKAGYESIERRKERLNAVLERRRSQ